MGVGDEPLGAVVFVVCGTRLVERVGFRLRALRASERGYEPFERVREVSSPSTSVRISGLGGRVAWLRKSLRLHHTQQKWLDYQLVDQHSPPAYSTTLLGHGRLVENGLAHYVREVLYNESPADYTAQRACLSRLRALERVSDTPVMCV